MALRGRWPWQLLAAPGDIPELLGRVEVAPGQAVATELGWPGPLHSVTVGTGVGPARSPQPQRVLGVSPCPGEQLQGGAAVWSGQWWPEQSWEWGWRAPSSPPGLFISSLFSTSFPYLDLLFLSSPPLLAILVILLLSSSLSSLLLGCLLFLLFSLLGLPSSFPSSPSLLDLPSFLLGLIITSLASSSPLWPLSHLLSSPVSSLQP